MKKHRSVDKKSGVEQFNRISYNREMTAMAVVEPESEQCRNCRSGMAS